MDHTPDKAPAKSKELYEGENTKKTKRSLMEWGMGRYALSPGAKNVPEQFQVGEGRTHGAKSANFPAALSSIVNCG